MKTGRLALAVGAIIGGTAMWHPAAAATVAFPKIARNFVAYMARAMDQCSPATISVTSPGVPSGGCPQMNVQTDNQITFNFARLIVNARTGRVLVFGRGFPFGARIKVQLTLRTTKHGINTKHPAAGNQSVTFADKTILCPNTSFGFVVRPSGVLFGSTSLADCLGSANAGLATGNVEIIDAAMVNIDNTMATPKVFARPGILR